MKDLFLQDSQDDFPVVFSDRILYTPTSFAKTALLYLQEIGSLQAKKPHTSSRDYITCQTPAKKYKLYKSSINKSLHFAQRSLSSSTRVQRVTAQLNLSRE